MALSSTVLNQLLLPIFSVLFLTSCINHKMSVSKNSRLTHEILIDIVAQQANYQKDKIIYVDSLLQYREFFFKKEWFDNADSIDKAVKTVGWQKSFYPFSVPDSLKDRIRMVQANADVEHSQETFFYFSPLLPTSENHIYVIQEYSVISFKDEEFLFRVANRTYRFYKILANKITRIANRDMSDGPISLPIR
jgi:hypothetical protein